MLDRIRSVPLVASLLDGRRVEGERMPSFDRFAPAAPSLAAALAVVVLVAACGGPGAAGPVVGLPSAGDPSGGDGVPGGMDARGQVSADGPVRLTVDGTTHGYAVGRCEIIDDVVYVTAMTDDAAGQFEATLPAWDRELAYAQRDGSVTATVSGADSSGFDLAASRTHAGTSWEWTVSGSEVRVTAIMAHRSTVGASTVAERPDVAIEIDCPGGQFGSGPYAVYFEEEFFPIEPGLERALGDITIDLSLIHI